MLRLFAAIALAVVFHPLATAQTPPAETEKWIPLFNGKDLEGWTPKIKGYASGENFGNTFRVEDGCIKVNYEKYDKFNQRYGHLFYKEKFSHYRIRVEYRFVGTQCPGGEGWALRNSGIMLHGQTPESMGKDQNFPVSIEVQLLGGDGRNNRTTANVCSPGTHLVMNNKLITAHCNSSKSKTFHGDQWVTCEVEVRGSGKIKHFINGELVLEYEKPQYDPKDADAKPLIKGDDLLLKEGTISLQSESHPVEFRKVEILKLEPNK
jgi:beta-glucanase (GH16 family)